MEKITVEQIHTADRKELEAITISLLERVDRLSSNVEYLMEQIRIANSHQFGRKTEKLDVLCNGQLSFFDEAEKLSEENVSEPEYEEVVTRRKKQKGKREEDLKDIPVEKMPVHSVSREELNAFFGEGNYRQMESEIYHRLRFCPASWINELHTVEVYIGTGGEHQDEFLRGKRTKDLIPNSLVTPSLGAAILNAKYVNASPLYRIEQEFRRNGINISRQTMANWVIYFSRNYLHHIWDRMKDEQLKLHVSQSDETTVQVLQDRSEKSGSQLGYMWVHRSGEFYKEKPSVLFEYQKSRAHTVPLEFYKDFKGVLMTDGLSQYHLLDKKLEDLTSANCWAHARRDYADALKAIGSKNSRIKHTAAYKALARIAGIYKLEESFKDLSPEERLRERQKELKPLVEEYFEWVRNTLNTTLPKGKTAEGLNYSINQEKYLRAFLDDGEIPIDNSACERSIRPFTIGRKNWLFIDSIKGAEASAVVYSLVETAKLNNLNPYQYLKYLLEQLPGLVNKEGGIDDPGSLDALLPWSTDLPMECYNPRRS